MFGNLGAFVNGNMFMGLFGASIGVKVPDAETQKVMKFGGGPFGPAERPMSGYGSPPTSTTPAKARSWIAKSFVYVSALPPKPVKGAKKTEGQSPRAKR